MESNLAGLPGVWRISREGIVQRRAGQEGRLALHYGAEVHRDLSNRVAQLFELRSVGIGPWKNHDTNANCLV